MEQLIEKFRQKVSRTKTSFVRGIISEVNWNARLIGIKGARGIGKTTMILQYIKLNLADQLNQCLYVSLDNIWFSENKLVDLVDNFVKRGGKYLFLDEVHKYPQWSLELKNIYDDYPDLKLVFTGSSLLEILNARADLSRRAVVYQMQGLSYREFLSMTLQQEFPVLKFEDVLSSHIEISQDILSKIKPLQYFNDYLKFGYYPFFREEEDLYYSRLEEVINMILEIELPILRNVDVSYVRKLKQLLLIISESAPFIPNISKLSERIGINRQTLISYLFYLNDSNLIQSLYRDLNGITLLQKPDKLFLENTNLMFALQRSKVEVGNIRETFFMNQLKYNHQVEFLEVADFKVDENYVFEIGGKNKGRKQIKNLNNAFIVSDDIEYGFEKKIPIWMFGMLY